MTLLPKGQVHLQRINDPVIRKNGVDLLVLRLDGIHPGISGNKWYKLKYNLKAAIENGHNTILTFGGAYSNHIHAMAIAANEMNVESIGVIRGEKVEPLNPTLRDAERYGMKLEFITRTTYRQKSNEKLIDYLNSLFGKFYLVPEGGTNNLGIKGAAEILEEIKQNFDYICVSVGTGGTIAGLISGLNGEKNVIGISALKGGFLKEEIDKLLKNYNGESYSNWELLDGYHFGGYAKYNDKLISFINSFKKQHEIPLDPIYTGKMMYALYDLVDKGYFGSGSKIVVVHSGGIQGIRGFNERFGNRIFV